MSEFNLKDYLVFKNRRNVINLYKSFLIILEDLQPEVHISDEKYQKIRKRILDSGNDSIRQFEQDLDNFM